MFVELFFDEILYLIWGVNNKITESSGEDSSDSETEAANNGSSGDQPTFYEG